MKKTATFPSSAQRNGGHAPLANASSREWWPLVAAVAQRWRWFAWGGALFALFGFLAGRALWSTKFTAVAQLIRYETPDPMLFQPRVIAAPTLASMIESTEVRTRVGAAAQPPLSAEAVAGVLRIVPERSSDILNIAISGNRRDDAVAFANRYAAEAVRFTQELQSKEAADAARYLASQLAKVEDDITRLNQKLRLVAPPPAKLPGAPRLSSVLLKLEEARDQLADLLLRYTDAHPLVQEQTAKVVALEKQLDEVAKKNPGVLRPTARTEEPAPTQATSVAGTEDYEGLREVSKALESQRLTLASRLRLTQMLQNRPPGYYRLFAPATAEHAVVNHPSVKILFLAVLAGLAGIVAAAGCIVAAELFDPRLRTGADVQRVARLPVLASLGDMAHMTPAQQARWAFRTWTALQHRLTASPNLGLVCGVTSSTSGEGRSLWIRLLSGAANQCGFRVLTISTRPSPPHEELERAEAVDLPAAPPRPNGTSSPTLHRGEGLATNILATPTAIAQQLVDPNGPPLVHIPLPGWVWNLERRKEWQAALEHWRRIDNLVILVELPPADVPEAVLLAQNLPNLVWLADCTRATAPETCAQLTTLHHARCNIVGAVLNRESKPLGLDRFARWVPTLAAAWLTALSPPPMSGQEESPSAPATLSVTSPVQRAGWQKKLTLGPGDVLRLSLYGEPTLTQPEVAIQPDGRISFLEARDMMAAGLTIDELRAKLDEELARYRRAPRTMVAPLSFHSKKYFMLGKVVQKGVFTLDRPMTVVEAVARAKGFETGLSGRNLVELADLTRSFLVRHGSRAPLDFEKLFAAGDLSQNIPVEPDDYFYFPPTDVQEIYLLGEVTASGPVTFTENLAAVNAIATRGGFAPRAWRQRVLVVRGALKQPETFVVDVPAVLSAKQPDFKLQPRDLVYVSARPWIKAEDLLDAAASAFAQSVVVFWTTDKVIPVVR